MATDLEKRYKKLREQPIRKYIAVDLWRDTFGEYSERAIIQIFLREFNVKKENISNYTFTYCVDALRNLEDPNYEIRE